MIETEDVHCNLCGSDDSMPLLEARDRLHGVEGCFHYVQCRSCGLVYMNPQVTPESIAPLYPECYAGHVDKTKSSRRGLMRLRDGLQKAPVLGTELKRWTDARVMAPLFGKLTAEMRLLDVGCGSGAFLDSVRAGVGCQVEGIDISEKAVEVALKSYGLNIFHGTIAEAPFEDESFDAITAWWYLEHIPNPNEAVAQMSRLLRRGGTCVIGVPNHRSFWARVFKDKWYHLDCPRHLCIWTPAAMKRLLEAHGLSVTRIYYDRSPWGLLGSLQYLFYGDNTNPKHRNRIRQSALLWLLFLPLTIIVSLVRRSDIMVVYAEKRTGS